MNNERTDMIEVDDLIVALEVYGNKEGTEAQLNETASLLREILECAPAQLRASFLRRHSSFVKDNQEDDDDE